MLPKVLNRDQRSLLDDVLGHQRRYLRLSAQKTLASAQLSDSIRRAVEGGLTSYRTAKEMGWTTAAVTMRLEKSVAAAEGKQDVPSA